MKILTIAGTRPELIDLAILRKLEEVSTHINVHTNQNYDPN
jgi:UDP-N-acetylglucosamine 2-epimerase